jgi:hypothetical protein
VQAFTDNNAVVLFAVTSGIGSSSPAMNLAAEQARKHFPGAYFTNTKLLSLTASGGVPFGAVIDLETLEVIEKEPTGDSYITLMPQGILQAVQAANAD